jgi:hypothetical protein
MLPETQHVRLPLEADWFWKSLSETVVWCMKLPLKIEAEEDPDTRFRRQLGQRAGELHRRAHLSNWPEFVKNFQYKRASRMFAKARLEEIAPLHVQLRSSALRPQPFLPDASREKCSGIVRDIVARRAERLGTEGRSPTSPIADLANGRLLLLAPADTLSDGAARYSSKGFFDIDNVPPWDTWVWFVEKYVVSWVPPQLIELANAGVEVNPEQCIFWA